MTCPVLETGFSTNLNILGLPWDTMDLMLYGIEHGMDNDVIAEQLNLPAGKILEIRSLVQQTEHMRNEKTVFMNLARSAENES